jgi:hypothetical protein
MSYTIYQFIKSTLRFHTNEATFHLTISQDGCLDDPPQAVCYFLYILDKDKVYRYYANEWFEGTILGFSILEILSQDVFFDRYPFTKEDFTPEK